MPLSSGINRAVSAAFLATLAGLLLLTACGDTGLQTTGAQVPSLAAKPGDFDDIEIDQPAHRLYAADRADSGIDVFDIKSPPARFLRTIKLPDAPNGLALAPDLERLFAGTAGGSVEIIDTRTQAVTGAIRTGAKEVDLLDYGAAAQLLFASTGGDGTVLTIDPRSATVLSTAKVGKPLEQPRYDPADGMVYVSVPELDALAQIDPKDGTVKTTIKLGGCIPRGLAINPVLQTAVMSCRQSVMAFDLATGHSQTFARVADGDVVQYDPAVDRFFVTSPHDLVPSVVGIFGGDPVGYVSSVNVNGGGNAAAYDEANDLVYTTDPRQGRVGVMAFRMDGIRALPVWQSVLATVGPFLLLAALVIPVWLFIGRSADPVHRQPRAPKGAPVVVLAEMAPKTTEKPSFD